MDSTTLASAAQHGRHQVPFCDYLMHKNKIRVLTYPQSWISDQLRSATVYTGDPLGPLQWKSAFLESTMMAFHPGHSLRCIVSAFMRILLKVIFRLLYWIAQRHTDAFQGLWSRFVGPVGWLRAVPFFWGYSGSQGGVKGPACQQAFLKTHCPCSLCQDHLWGFLKHPSDSMPRASDGAGPAFRTSAVRVTLMLPSRTTLGSRQPLYHLGLVRLIPGDSDSDSGGHLVPALVTELLSLVMRSSSPRGGA